MGSLRPNAAASQDTSAGNLQPLQILQFTDISPAGSPQDTSYDCLADPVLQAVHQAFPVHVVGGYAAVDDATLAWPGAPLFLLGRPAQLALGPSARELCPEHLGVKRLFCCKILWERGAVLLLPTVVVRIQY